jgi:hypothetical protein
VMLLDGRLKMGCVHPKDVNAFSNKRTFSCAIIYGITTEIFFKGGLTPRPERLWGPSSLLSNGY